MTKPLLGFHLTAWTVAAFLAKPMLASVSLFYMLDASMLPHVSSLDIIIGILGFAGGAFTVSKRFKNLVIFLEVSVIVLRIIRYYLKTHTATPKVPESLANKVEHLYHTYTPLTVRAADNKEITAQNGTTTRIPY